MSDDPMDWLNEHIRAAKIYSGREPTPQTMYNDFLRRRNAERTEFLKQLDTKIEAAHLSLNNAADLHRIRSRLIDAHRAALRVNR
ncbi:MAG: hypothetical protein JO254_04730 [Pseudolabrys sp.]|nr:hypothetical protein [Pseudolabrys sp.]